MAASSRLRLHTILRHVTAHRQTIEPCSRAASSVPAPVLKVQPESGGLCDEVLDIEARGLVPGQVVTLQAQVYTENAKYRFLSSGQYKAKEDGSVQVQKDPSLGGSYEGVEPMGLFWSLRPAPEVAHKHPRLVKWDIGKPFSYTLELLEGAIENGRPNKVLASKVIERTYLPDYVERIPVKMGGAEGVLFLPKQRGSSDPLPLIIDIRGLLSRLVVDRAAVLASHGFAVFAFDYFLPRRIKSTEENVYIDAQAFLDIIKYAEEHPRLDGSRIGMTSSCYGGAMMLHATTRLRLPVKCLVAAGFTDVLSVCVGWKNLDGSLLEPKGPLDDYVTRHTDPDGTTWLSFSQEITGTKFEDRDKSGINVCLADQLECPLLMFAHKDDQHIPSFPITMNLLERLKAAGKGHLVDCQILPGTGHFLEVPFQPINVTSSLFDPTTIGGTPKMYYTNYGGSDTVQSARDQIVAWRKIVNFFHEHLETKEKYRTDWLTT